jgi:hypothetical protein
MLTLSQGPWTFYHGSDRPPTSLTYVTRVLRLCTKYSNLKRASKVQEKKKVCPLKSNYESHKNCRNEHTHEYYLPRLECLDTCKLNRARFR